MTSKQYRPPILNPHRATSLPSWSVVISFCRVIGICKKGVVFCRHSAVQQFARRPLWLLAINLRSNTGKLGRSCSYSERSAWFLRIASGGEKFPLNFRVIHFLFRSVLKAKGQRVNIETEYLRMKSYKCLRSVRSETGWRNFFRGGFWNSLGASLLRIVDKEKPLSEKSFSSSHYYGWNTCCEYLSIVIFLNIL